MVRICSGCIGICCYICSIAVEVFDKRIVGNINKFCTIGAYNHRSNPVA